GGERRRIGEDHGGLQRDQFFRECLRLCTGRRKASVDADIAAFRPSTLFQPLPECREASLGFRIVLGERHEHADAPHSLALLRARRERPRGSRAAEQCDELAPFHHSITSSARASTVGGSSRPSALAVLRLITSSYLVGAGTGRSAACSPLSRRSTYAAACRYWSRRSAP